METKDTLAQTALNLVVDTLWEIYTLQDIIGVEDWLINQKRRQIYDTTQCRKESLPGTSGVTSRAVP